MKTPESQRQTISHIPKLLLGRGRPIVHMPFSNSFARITYVTGFTKISLIAYYFKMV